MRNIARMIEVDTQAKILWDYHHMNHTLHKADLILVLGSHDLRIADYGAHLWQNQYAPILMFSGGIAHQGDLLKTQWDESEAEMFAKRALSLGVPEKSILIENKSTNTGENIANSRTTLEQNNIIARSIILVQKPYMERRAYATFKKQWPEPEILVTSPPISYSAYPTEEIKKDDIINLMVGDLQRIKIYADKGFQIKQEIPADIWNAYDQLVSAGYTQHLVPE